jgi:hypothetical protein
MIDKQFWPASGLTWFTALALGLAWALRGHFGHEYGAAWAGAVGTMALVLFSRRADWHAKVPVLALLGGIGWGVGGMMSYGLLVGFGRSTDFGNVLYGLAMLAVVGGLYGFIGAGFFALELETTHDKKPDWATLLTQMIAGALLFWYVLIAQFEIKMTPPRSELWAACLGASVALAWYLQRNHFHRTLRLALVTALTAGFGFAFGNFLQTMGVVSGVSFNWWNVMEFTLGFCGGLGLAYGVATQDWPTSREVSTKSNRIALLLLFALLPMINLFNAFDVQEFIEMAIKLNVVDPIRFAHLQYYLGLAVVLLISTAAFWLWRKQRNTALFFLLTAFYIIFSHLKKGFFFSVNGLQMEQYLYWLLFFVLAILYCSSRTRPAVLINERKDPRAIFVILVFLLSLVLFAFISINSHSGLAGAHLRF